MTEKSGQGCKENEMSHNKIWPFFSMCQNYKNSHDKIH